jgi:hypothetical protein
MFEIEKVGRKLSASTIASALEAIPRAQIELESHNACRAYRSGPRANGDQNAWLGM